MRSITIGFAKYDFISGYTNKKKRILSMSNALFNIMKSVKK